MRTRCSLVATVALLVPFTGLAQNMPWRASLRLADVNLKSTLGTVPSSATSFCADSGFGIELGAAFKVAPTWEVEVSALRSSVTFRTESLLAAGYQVGTADLMVVTAALQHRIFTTGRCQPYVGVGAHIASFSGFAATRELVSSGIASIDFASSVSVTAQIGASFKLSERLAVDLRATYHDYATDADVLLPDGGLWNTLRLDVDPWTIAAGVDFRF